VKLALTTTYEVDGIPRCHSNTIELTKGIVCDLSEYSWPRDAASDSNLPSTDRIWVGVKLKTSEYGQIKSVKFVNGTLAHGTPFTVDALKAAPEYFIAGLTIPTSNVVSQRRLDVIIVLADGKVIERKNIEVEVLERIARR
jgi:hypothetical protein